MLCGHPPTKTLYDTDFAEWTARRAALLRAGSMAEVDLEHVAGGVGVRVGWREMVRPEISCHDDVVVEWAGKRGKECPHEWGQQPGGLRYGRKAGVVKTPLGLFCRRSKHSESFWICEVVRPERFELPTY